MGRSRRPSTCCDREGTWSLPATACTVRRPTWSSRPARASTATPWTTYVQLCVLLFNDRLTPARAQGIGEFILTHPDIKIPSRGKIYSFNEGNSMFFHEPVLKYLESVKYPKSGKPYSARYIGSMVADVHRTLLYGGIFGYPDDKKSKNGKLRILYEGFPMAFLTEQVRPFHSMGLTALADAGEVRTQAGGIATTGTKRVLDIEPTEIHQRCPIFLGSKEDVEDLQKFFA